MYTGERKQTILENLIYLIIWLTIFFTPVMDFWYSQEEIIWGNIFRIWKMMTPFLLFFIINNYFLIPHFLIRKRSWVYPLITLFLISVIYLISPIRTMNKMLLENRALFEERMEMEMPFPPVQKGEPGEFRSPMDKRLNEEFPPDLRRIPFMRTPFANYLFSVLLLIGLNIAIKLLFRSLLDAQRMKELEKQTLQTELEYLKHQINPHFFMNTLNNIHALVDIDTEKAKSTILELSKMMRYLLYDTSQSVLPLKKEIRFLSNYIELMRIRYTGQVDIHISLPKEIPDVKVPPLLFISFIENAFKHGISYQKKSFIHVSMEIQENELHCLCINSSFDNAGIQCQGIGLDNVRKRLQLLYNNNYTLKIKDNMSEYHVLLIIPLNI